MQYEYILYILQCFKELYVVNKNMLFMLCRCNVYLNYLDYSNFCTLSGLVLWATVDVLVLRMYYSS